MGFSDRQLTEFPMTELVGIRGAVEVIDENYHSEFIFVVVQKSSNTPFPFYMQTIHMAPRPVDNGDKYR